jgi:ABC-type polysaccharide/polyol phosphate export permease
MALVGDAQGAEVAASRRARRTTRRRKPTLLSVFPAAASTYHRRDVLWFLILRSLRAQYKQSILGYAWLLINPLTQLATLTFIFSVVFTTPSEGVPFFLFLAVGLFPWLFFSNATSQATESVASATTLITTVYFPRDFLVISAVLIRLFDLVAGAVIIGIGLAVTGQSIHLAALWVVPLFLLQFLFVVGLSLPLAALNLFFHDVRFLVGIVLNLWFFFTPIFYSVKSVPERFQLLYDLNPLARFIGSYRYAVLEGGSPPLGSLALASLTAIAALMIGYYLFQRMEPRFADRI